MAAQIEVRLPGDGMSLSSLPRVPERVLQNLLAPAPCADLLGYPQRYHDGQGLPDHWARLGRTVGPNDGLHAFVDDWRLESLYRKGPTAVPDVTCMVEPDYSVYAETPVIVAAWQTFRARLVGSWCDDRDIPCLPVLQWGGPDTYCWC
ncbi:MAG: DUF4417 domain-containing protein, partial [Thiohalocapsa sp.]